MDQQSHHILSVVDVGMHFFSRILFIKEYLGSESSNF